MSEVYSVASGLVVVVVTVVSKRRSLYLNNILQLNLKKNATIHRKYSSIFCIELSGVILIAARLYKGKRALIAVETRAIIVEEFSLLLNCIFYQMISH